MSFARPAALLLALVALPLLVFAYRAVERRRAGQALAYSNLAFALDALQPSRWPAALLSASFMLGAGALLAALAGPRFTARIPLRDAVVVLCIDTSGSMRARDVAPSRAAAARASAEAFLGAVPAGTRVGIVTFAGGANLIAEPTADLDAARDALARIPSPDGGTAIGDALTLAAQTMPAAGRRIIVLLTDGVNNRGWDPMQAAQSAAARGIVIETVGVGTSGSGEVIPGTAEPADLDAAALQAIASYGHGRYVEAANAAALRGAFRGIALQTVWEQKRIDGSLPFALAGGFLLVFAFLFGLGAGRFP